jgi:flavin-dependent dehydrogenase
MRQAAGPGWALVGDAGYFKDPLTAHGITDALRDAELLANAAAGDSAAAWQRYEEERNDLSLTLFQVTDEIASFDWDLETIRTLQRQLNDAMKREVASISAFDVGDRGLAA